MGHKLRVELDLTDEQYETLMTEMRRSRQEIKAVLEELIDELHVRQIQFTPHPSQPIPAREAFKRLAQKGVFSSVPSGEPFSKEDEIELRRLGDLLGQMGGKPASEMAIEDRGPY